MFVRHIVHAPLLMVVAVLAIVHPAIAQRSIDGERWIGWSTLGQLSSARSNVGAVPIGDGRILVVGGSTGIPIESDPRAIPTSECEIIDVWNKRIQPAARMNEPRSEFAVLLTRDSNVIVIGGVVGVDPNGAVTANVERYDRRQNTWTVIGSLKTARRQHVAGFIDSNRILVVGGRRSSYATLTDAEIFDIRTGTTVPAAPFPFPINGSTLITSHAGELVVVGGREGGANSARRSDVYAYDPVGDVWVLNRVLGEAVSEVKGLRLWDRRIIIAGGLQADLPANAVAAVQLENVGKFKLIAPMQRPRSSAALAQWTENRVLAIGGFHNDRVPVATTEWIDMNRHLSEPGPMLSVPRDRFVALSIHARRNAPAHEHTIVVIGGVQNAASLTSAVEILEP